MAIKQDIKTKYRKWQKSAGQGKGFANRGTTLAFGNFGLKALGSGRLRQRQLEAARVAIRHEFKKRGKVWIRSLPNKPVCRKPAEVPMGKGKGEVSHWVTFVRPGRIILEVDGIEQEIAREALRKAKDKLPIKCKIISKD